jgi:hypothetical protein
MLYRAASAHNLVDIGAYRRRAAGAAISFSSSNRSIDTERCGYAAPLAGLARPDTGGAGAASQRMLAVIRQLAGQHSGGGRRSSRDRGGQRFADDERCLEGACQILATGSPY